MLKHALKRLTGFCQVRHNFFFLKKKAAVNDKTRKTMEGIDLGGGKKVESKSRTTSLNEN